MGDLNGTIVKIDTAGLIQTDVSLGSAASESSKLKMGNIILRFALRSKEKAKKLGMLTLAHQLDEPISHYTSGAKVDMILKAKNTKNLIRAYSTTQKFHKIDYFAMELIKNDLF